MPFPELTNEDWRMILAALFVREMDTDRASRSTGHKPEKQADLKHQSEHCRKIITKIKRGIQ